MKLTQEQKESLQGLVKHPGFKVLEYLEEQDSIELGKGLAKIDLNNETERNKLREMQIYIKARADFLQNIRKNTVNIVSNDIKLY